MARLASVTLQAALAMVMGFALLELPPVTLLFDVLAQALAVISAALLNLFGFAITRTGSELRDVTGWAVDVTTVCDGHGLIIAWGGLITALRPGWHAGLRAMAVGILAIILFNLIRIVALAATLAHAPTAFGTVHAYVFPLLTVGLMLHLSGAAKTWAVALVMTGMAALWFFLGPLITSAIFVPLANTCLALVGPEGIGTIALRAPGWTVDSTLIARADPLAFHMAGFDPNDFTLAVPVLLAAVVLVRPVWPGFALGVLLIMVTLLTGASAALWSVASANDVSEMAIRELDGLRAVPYAPAGETARAAMSLIQNVLVHLNLLVLPVLILSASRRKVTP
jgi:exosortase/archaeosortase family protein